MICNPSYDPDNTGPSTANVVLGLVVATCSLCYTAWSARVYTRGPAQMGAAPGRGCERRAA